MRNLYLLIFPRTAKILQIMRFFMIPESCISQNNFSHAKCEIAPGKTKGSRDGIWEMQSPWGDGNYARCSTRYSSPIWEMQSPWGDGNLLIFLHTFLSWHLRNAVPVRGRKPDSVSTLTISTVFIWEMQSPWGDGNSSYVPFVTSTIIPFEKCSPREGTETPPRYYRNININPFEKCSPREGTETNFVCAIF